MMERVHLSRTTIAKVEWLVRKGLIDSERPPDGFTRVINRLSLPEIVLSPYYEELYQDMSSIARHHGAISTDSH